MERVSRRSILLTVLAFVVFLGFASHSYAAETPFPGAELTQSPVSDSLHMVSDPSDYYRLRLEDNQQVRVVVNTARALEADVAIWSAKGSPSSDFDKALAHDTGGGIDSEVLYNRTGGASGDVSVQLKAVSGSGSYMMGWQLLHAVDLVQDVSDEVIPYAGQAVITGTLTDLYTSSPATNQPVILWYSYDKKYWKRSSTQAVTDAVTGEFTLTVSPTIFTYYRTTLGGANGVGYAISSAVSVKPKVYLSSPSVPSSVRRRSNFGIYGYLKPRHVSGGKVVKLYFEHREGGRWVRKYSFSAVSRNYSSYTRYVATASLRTTGSWRVRAYHVSPQHAATYSAYRYFKVK